MRSRRRRCARCASAAIPSSVGLRRRLRNRAGSGSARRPAAAAAPWRCLRSPSLPRARGRHSDRPPPPDGLPRQEAGGRPAAGARARSPAPSDDCCARPRAGRSGARRRATSAKSDDPRRAHRLNVAALFTRRSSAPHRPVPTPWKASARVVCFIADAAAPSAKDELGGRREPPLPLRLARPSSSCTTSARHARRAPSACSSRMRTAGVPAQAAGPDDFPLFREACPANFCATSTLHDDVASARPRAPSRA